MILGIKLLGFKGWLGWKKEELTYKFKQRKYWKAVEVLDDVIFDNNLLASLRLQPIF